jgi:alpha-galactosidase
MKSLLLTTVLAFAMVPSIQAQPPAKLAPTPPMGWNSWNWHSKKNINETVVRETIDAMASSGLRDAGYNYVVVDGGWRATELGPNGELLAHPVKFPGGMKALADYAHSKGLKFGVHTTPGTHDCGGDAVGGFGHEEVHVKQFVEWGLDFVKVDKCKFQPGWTEEQVQAVYAKWSHLLAHCGRDMVFSISAYVYRDWYPGVCHMARTTYDIRDHNTGGARFDDGKPRSADNGFLSVMIIAEENNRSAAAAGPGFWNDADMLVVGRHGMTQEEQKAHFALWCIMSSPLMLGNDPRDMTPEEKAILLNREAIAINQDPTEQGRRIRQADGTEVWVKKLSGNRRAVLLLNRSDSTAKPITLQAGDVGLTGELSVRDVFGRQDLGVFKSSLTKLTQPRSGWFLLVTGQNLPATK